MKLKYGLPVFFAAIFLSIAIVWCFSGSIGYAAATVDRLRSATQPVPDAQAVEVSSAFTSDIVQGSASYEPAYRSATRRDVDAPSLAFVSNSGVYRGYYVGQETAAMLREEGIYCSRENLAFGALVEEYRRCQETSVSCSPARIRRKLVRAIGEERYRTVPRIPLIRLVATCNEMRPYLKDRADIGVCDFG